MDNPQISIILPNYNGDKYLVQAIESFLHQDLIQKELIIVDGKSTDNSHDIIIDFSEKFKSVKWIKEIDSGISNAFNIGLNYATGNIIGYLGSDDILCKNIFAEIDTINSWSNFDAVYFNSYTFYPKNKKCDLRKCPDLVLNIDNLLSYGTIVGWQNIYFKKLIYDKYKVNENNKTCMDYEFYLEVLSNTKENLLIIKSEIIATINIFDGNISSDTNGDQFKEAVSVATFFAKRLNYEGKIYGIIQSDKKSFISKSKNYILKKLVKLLKSA
jgi:glycosyltransferase involved in cell wall biosynthesis